MSQCNCGYVFKNFGDMLVHIETASENDADVHQVEIDDPSEIAEELGV